MKRDIHSAGGPPNKVQRPEGGTVVRYLVPGKAAGLIIGKKGETIKNIRKNHTAKMYIPDASGPERVFYCEAELSTCGAILRELCPKLKGVMDGKLSDPKAMGRRKKDEDAEEEDTIDIRILVHQSQAGSVIGKGGERIRELRTKYNMKVIKVYQMAAPNSTDRVVQMVASPDNVAGCMESVVEALEAAPPRGPRSDYDANYFDESMAMQYGGFSSVDGQRMMGGGPGMGQGMYGPPQGMQPNYGYGMPPYGAPNYDQPRGGPNQRGRGGKNFNGPPRGGGGNYNSSQGGGPGSYGGGYNQGSGNGGQYAGSKGGYSANPPQGQFSNTSGAPPAAAPVGYAGQGGNGAPPTSQWYNTPASGGAGW